MSKSKSTKSKKTTGRKKPEKPKRTRKSKKTGPKITLDAFVDDIQQFARIYNDLAQQCFDYLPQMNDAKKSYNDMYEIYKDYFNGDQYKELSNRETHFIDVILKLVKIGQQSESICTKLADFLNTTMLMLMNILDEINKLPPKNFEGQQVSVVKLKLTKKDIAPNFSSEETKLH